MIAILGNLCAKCTYSETLCLDPKLTFFVIIKPLQDNKHIDIQTAYSNSIASELFYNSL